MKSFLIGLTLLASMTSFAEAREGAVCTIRCQYDKEYTGGSSGVMSYVGGMPVSTTVTATLSAFGENAEETVNNLVQRCSNEVAGTSFFLDWADSITNKIKYSSRKKTKLPYRGRSVYAIYEMKVSDVCESADLSDEEINNVHSDELVKVDHITIGTSGIKIGTWGITTSPK